MSKKAIKAFFFYIIQDYGDMTLVHYLEVKAKAKNDFQDYLLEQVINQDIN